MSVFKVLWEFLKGNPEIVYMVSVCIVTYTILSVCKVTNKKIRRLVTFGVGVFLAIIYVYFIPCNLALILLALFATTGFYKYIMKPILKKLNITYPEEDGD